MPINPSIPLQVTPMRVQAPDPLQTAGQFMTLRNLTQQGQVLKQRELDMQRDREFAEAKAKRDAKLGEINQRKAQLDAASAEFDVFGRVAGSITDEASYRRAIPMIYPGEQAQQYLALPWEEAQAVVKQLRTMGLTAEQQLQEGYRKLEEERGVAAEGRAVAEEARKIEKQAVDLQQTRAQTAAIGAPTGSLREFKESYYPGWLAERGLQKSAANEKRALEEFRRPQRAAVPGVDTPLPASVEAQKTRISKESRPERQKVPTMGQETAAGFASRIEQANAIFEELEPTVSKMSTVRMAAERAAPNFAKSDTMQSQEQAERNFVNAVLRRESGAAIAESEFKNAAKQYFPQAGDSPSVLAQKRANRAQVFASMKSASGRAYQPPVEAPATTTEVPTVGGTFQGERVRKVTRIE